MIKHNHFTTTQRLIS